MNSNDPRSTDFAYKKYSLEQLDNWVNDALNCEDLTPEDIYDTVIKCVDGSVEYHKKYLTKSIELLSLLKGNRPVHDYLEEYQTTPFSAVSEKDWEDFWSAENSQYTEDEMDAMCDAAADKEKCREYNLREAEYYNKRAQLDNLYEEIKKAGGYDWTPEPPKKKLKTYQDMVDEGWTMTADGFWIKK